MFVSYLKVRITVLSDLDSIEPEELVRASPRYTVQWIIPPQTDIQPARHACDAGICDCQGTVPSLFSQVTSCTVQRENRPISRTVRFKSKFLFYDMFRKWIIHFDSCLFTW
jgi:hypothetical protein